MGKKWSFEKRPASTFTSDFARSRSGNVAIIYALCATVLLGLLGLTVDFTRAQTLRAQMQNAADGAALVAERSSNLPIARRKELAEAFFNAEMGSDIPNMDFDVVEIASGGHQAIASYPMPLTLASLVRNQPWTIRVSAEAQARASPPIEVVLALDNTGSMSADMQTLRDGAEDLVDYLLSIDGNTVHVGLVPFVAQVNIGTSHTAWIDQAGANPYNGVLLEGRYLGRRNTTNNACTDAATYPTEYPAAPVPGRFPVRWIRGNANNPSGYTNTGRCYAFSPENVNIWSLYSNLPTNAQWGGCVEMRPPPYDIDDTPPTTSIGSTMFVPYFSLDDGNDVGNPANNWITDNNYDRRDQLNLGLSSNAMGNENELRTLGVYKYRRSLTSPYNTTPVSVSTNNTSGRGPNRGCPTPIVPLTTNRSTVVNAVRGMLHWNGGGTNQIEGLAWAWRVLSPGAPFTEGAPYNSGNGPPTVRKVIVLFTDGDNTSLANNNDALESDYAGLGYRSLYSTYQTTRVPRRNSDNTAWITPWPEAVASSVRRPDPTDDYTSTINSANRAVDYMIDRQEDLCDAIKAAGIEIYTVGFRISAGGDADDLLQYCATQDDAHFYHADNQQELLEAFSAIGSGIGDLRIVR